MKPILIKSFSHFTYHRSAIPSFGEPQSTWLIWKLGCTTKIYGLSTWKLFNGIYHLFVHFHFFSWTLRLVNNDIVLCNVCNSNWPPWQHGGLHIFSWSRCVECFCEICDQDPFRAQHIENSSMRDPTRYSFHSPIITWVNINAVN